MLHGRLDGLVVAAAPSAQTLDASRNSDPVQVLDAVDAKAMTFLRLANAVVPIMTESNYGRIVGVSGQNAYLTGNVTGAVRNAAMIITAKNLADELAGSGVTVNTVNPGTVSANPSVAVEPGRGGESSPDEIADLVAFLVSHAPGQSRVRRSRSVIASMAWQPSRYRESAHRRRVGPARRLALCPHLGGRGSPSPTASFPTTSYWLGGFVGVPRDNEVHGGDGSAP